VGALAAFRAAIHCKPDCASAHINLVALLLKRGQRDEALTHLHYAAKLNPQDHAPKELLEQLLKQTGAAN
jgi:tetratricopeptide (TPR) repeat protein